MPVNLALLHIQKATATATGFDLRRILRHPFPIHTASTVLLEFLLASSSNTLWLTKLAISALSAVSTKGQY